MTIIFVVSVCLSVCLCRVFLSRLWSDFDQTRTYVICLGLVGSPRNKGCATPGGWWPLKTCIFRGFGAQKTISSYSFDRIVLIFGYIVERTNTKILSSDFLQFPSWTRIMTSFPFLQKLWCGFHHWIAHTISWGEVSPFFSISYSFRVMTLSVTS